MKKYLVFAEDGMPEFEEGLIAPDDPLNGVIYCWNNGVYPYVPKDYKYLYIAVGYAKERESALVEVTDITFEPMIVKGIKARFFKDGNKLTMDPEGDLCIWQIVYHLGKVVCLHRK